MLLCYLLGGALFMSDGTHSVPVANQQQWILTRVWGTPAIEAVTNNNAPLVFMLDDSYADATVDEVLAYCDDQAHDPRIHQ